MQWYSVIHHVRWLSVTKGKVTQISLTWQFSHPKPESILLCDNQSLIWWFLLTTWWNCKMELEIMFIDVLPCIWTCYHICIYGFITVYPYNYMDLLPCMHIDLLPYICLWTCCHIYVYGLVAIYGLVTTYVYGLFTIYVYCNLEKMFEAEHLKFINRPNELN